MVINLGSTNNLVNQFQTLLYKFIRFLEFKIKFYNLLFLIIDFDYEFESKDEETIRAQLVFYQQTKIVKNNASVKGKTEKTKWSENYKESENENYSSDGEISLESVNDVRNSISRYFHNPSLMKNHKKYLGGGNTKHPHPAINKNLSKVMLNTDLSRIKNLSPARKQI